MSDPATAARLADERVLGTRQRRLRSASVILGTAFRADPLRALALVLTSATNALGAAGAAYVLKLVTDAVAQRDPSRVVPAIAVAALVSALSSLSSVGTFMLRLRVVESTQLLIDVHLIELCAGIPGIEHHERADYLDQVARLRERRQQIANSIGAITMTIGVLVQAVGTVGLLGTVHPILLLLPLFGLPSFFLEARAVKIERAAWEGATERFRRASHLFQLATTAAPGKELRIFGVAGELLARHRRLRDDLKLEMRGAGRRAARVSAVGWTVFSLGYIAALVFVVARALDGQASPGDVVLVVALGSQVNEQVSGLVGTMSWLLQSLDVVRRYLWLRDHAAAARPRASGAPAPERLTDGIRMHDVTFRYPGTEVDVLRNVDLHLPAGAIVAVVGDNGAGKTTLVKLLSRFYEPTSGRIAADGIDLADLDVDEWRGRMAAGFQDFARFELLARETVGVGDLPSMADDANVGAALMRAHADDVVAGLAKGLDTQLGKSFEDGQELSGGQWQKLALGRAMMREAPLLLVLDEPTSALDAETEHALFERYAGAAREVGARVGAITVLVSHRFSTVRMADLIVVIHANGVAECGTHRELLERGGLYAELYELQARSYR